MKKTVRALAIMALLNTRAYAQEADSAKVNQLREVVISDTKFAQSKEKSGKVIEIITAEDLVKKSGQSLAIVLSQAAGVEINGNQSANGKNLGYYIRGGKNRQILILIDGIPVTDASGISFEYDLRLLPVEQVERIEIMKGAASSLYGTGAATGVINITLKKSAKKEIEGNAYVNIGSNNTTDNHKYNGQDFNQGLSVNGNLKKVNYFAGFNSTETKGMSQIAGENYEPDSFSRQNLLGKLGFKATEKLTLDFFGNYDKIKNDYDLTYDNSGFNDTAANVTTSEQIRFGVAPKYKYNKGEFILNSGFTKITRDYNELNTYSNIIDFSLYESRSVVLDGFNKYSFSKQLFIVLGANYQFNDMKSQTPFSSIANENTKFNILDGYTTLLYNADFGLNINTGARLNNHSAYGNNFVYNINPSYNFKTGFPLKVLASYSTAYITPSLYQLYSEYGNANLTPEKNTTIEAGFEIELANKKVTITTVAFLREEKNAIDVDANYIYYNIDQKRKAKGIETSVLVDVTPKLTINANYTFNELDEPLQRLNPKHKVNVAANYQFTDRFFAAINYQYLSSRIDAFGFPSQFVKLDAYRLLNTTLKYVLIKNRLTVFGSATNLFNEGFIENIGYSTRGRNFKLGLNIIL